MFFGSRPSKQAAQLACIILSELLGLMVQAWLRRIQFLQRTSPCPVDIVVPDCDQNQIGKTRRSQQLADLPGKIPRAEDTAKKILTARLTIDQGADARILDRNKRR